MKIKFLITALFTFISISAFTQETNKKTREASIIFYNFQNYGLMYKSGKTNNKLWRFRLLSGGLTASFGDGSNSISNQDSQVYFNTSIGRERRKALGENLNLIYGIELTTGFNQTKTIRNSNLNPSSSISRLDVNAGLVGVFGLNYSIKEKIIIGVELLPSALYTYSYGSAVNAGVYPTQANTFRFGFNNNSALLSIGVRF